MAGETYIISSVITLTENLVLPPNVTLIIQGGRFESETEVEITADNTALVAPIDVIFGKNIKALGEWNIDRAYPQWFKAGIAYRFSFPADDDGNSDLSNPLPVEVKDMTDPINKAITMIGAGEVYMIRGDYNVTAPINIPIGVQLNGVASQNDGDKVTTGSRIIPTVKTKEEDRVFKYSHLIYINPPIINNKGEEEYTLSDVWTAISNITLMGYYWEVVPPLRCIYAAAGVTLDTVHWVYFPQAIEFRDMYSDAKVIRNCNYDPSPELPSDLIKTENEWDEYAFNLQGLGDALVFDNNHMGDGRPLLYIRNCGSGTINNNIINGDTHIEYSSAISYTNNHIENGGQISIKFSNVSTRGNYFEKLKRPSVKIIGFDRTDGNTLGSSEVSMENDLFVVYSGDRSTGETPQSKEERMQELSDVDILIDRSAILNINNVYRYDMVTGFGTTLPYGIKIETVDYNPDFQFNDYSYFASNKCSILRHEILQTSAAFHRLNNTMIYWVQRTNFVKWLRDSGSYRYQYRIVWDSRRHIYKEINGTTVFDVNINTQEVGEYENTVNLTKYDQGVLLSLSLEADYLNNYFKEISNCVIELFRYRINSSGQIESREKVVVPLCGAKQIFDNGISICGYKWRSMPNYGPIIKDPATNHYEMYRYIGGSVECAATLKPLTQSTGEWKKGDVIYNVGEDESWNLKIIK